VLQNAIWKKEEMSVNHLSQNCRLQIIFVFTWVF
jgi:hypothetical protein